MKCFIIDTKIKFVNYASYIILFLSVTYDLLSNGTSFVVIILSINLNIDNYGCTKTVNS